MLNTKTSRKNQSDISPHYFGPREYFVTADMADGQPLPPFIENCVPWRLMFRDAGYTLWSRPLPETSNTNRRNVLEGISRANNRNRT